MKSRIKKSCGNCMHYCRMRAHLKNQFGDWDFGGLCELFDAKGSPNCKRKLALGGCKFWKGIKYNRLKNKREFEKILKEVNQNDRGD